MTRRSWSADDVIPPEVERIADAHGCVYIRSASGFRWVHACTDEVLHGIELTQWQLCDTGVVTEVTS
jgi:hypothetical protein